MKKPQKIIIKLQMKPVFRFVFNLKNFSRFFTSTIRIKRITGTIQITILKKIEHKKIKTGSLREPSSIS